ncbi:MAG: response regulator, partial [bacterium]
MTEPAKKKILVVDDNPAFLQLVEMGFSGEFEIIMAYDGREGMAAAIKEKPDIILIDVMMPRVSGIE